METVPLNSPRPLMRLMILSTGIHTDTYTQLQEVSISRPTQPTKQPTKYYHVQHKQEGRLRPL